MCLQLKVVSVEPPTVTPTFPFPERGGGSQTDGVNGPKITCMMLKFLCKSLNDPGQIQIVL